MSEVYLSGIAIALIIVLSVLSVIRERSPSSMLYIFIALVFAAIGISEMVVLHSSYETNHLVRIVIIFESFLPILFALYSYLYARDRKFPPKSFFHGAVFVGAAIFPIIAVSVPLEKFVYSPDMQMDRMLFLGNAGYWFYMGIMMYCILALMNLEATLSAASSREKWKIKYELIGMGSIFAIYIFYYSQGLLYRTINMNLIPVRAGVTILAVLLIGYSKYMRGNNVRISLSRNVIYRSVTVASVGLYLIILGVIGEGMRYMGVSFSKGLGVFVAFLTALVMIMVMMSERLRRRIKVTISKNFLHHKYDYRIEWHKFTETLASCKTEKAIKDRILLFYNETFGLKGASLFLRNGERNCFLPAAVHSAAVTGGSELIMSDSLESYIRGKGRVLNPSDGEYEMSEMERDFVEKTEARIVVPLIINEDIIGLIVLGEQLSPDRYIYEDYDLMKTLGKQAALHIVNFRMSDELSETRELAAVAKISSFVVHDLKNYTSSLSLLLDNADAHIDNHEFQADMLRTLKGNVAKMKKLIRKLKTIPEKHVLQLESCDLHEIVQSMIDEFVSVRTDTDVRYEGKTVLARAEREEIKNVVLNLLLNAYDASGGQGEIRVETRKNGGRASIRVVDTGCGMSVDFMTNQLFKPFRTTKEKGLGIGLFQSKQIVEAHGGTIEVESTPEKGSAFSIHLPVLDE